MLGSISAVCNPSFLIANTVRGSLNAREFFSLAFSDLAGGIIAGVLVWLTYLPHFSLVPEVPAVLSDPSRQAAIESATRRRARAAARGRLPNNAALLLSSGRGYGAFVLNAASFEDDSLEQTAGLPEHASEIRTYLERAHERRVKAIETLERALEDVDPSTQSRIAHIVDQVKATISHDERETQKHIKTLRRAEQARADLEASRGLPGATANAAAGGTNAAADAADVASSEGSATQKAARGGGSASGGSPAKELLEFSALDGEGARGGARRRSLRSRATGWLAEAFLPTPVPDESSNPSESSILLSDPSLTPEDVEIEEALVRYKAKVDLDQNIKLSIFCTRPAIYNPFCNALCEFICTIFIVISVTMIGDRANTLYEPAREAYSAVIPGWVGMAVFIFVLNIGGPTGLAVNTARDLGPRIAHWFLPIPGKGPSEFLSYGWIPAIVPLAGGAAAGGFLLLIDKLTSRAYVSGTVAV